MRLTIAVPADQAGRAVAEACALAGTGCRERPTGEGTVELDLWLAPADADPGALRADLRAAGIAAEVAAAPETGAWREAMRAFHRPVEIGGVLRVRPPWAPARPPLHDVVIDPGMAFGTAQHATTRACLELLARVAPGGGSALDAGCGSGVLAIAARRLGLDPVWAVDADPLAVAATLANARRNGVGLRVGRRAIGADALPAADVLLANLTATGLGILAAHLPRPGPRAAILSGLRPDEAEGAVAAFAPAGLRAREVREAEGWAAVLMERAR